jgi:uncharacterized membrane protein YtjA (UPF0391 family)
MLQWAFIFLAIGIASAIFGYRGIASMATAIAKALFFLCIVIFLILLIAGLFGPAPTPTVVTPG